ncbi:uncharacterized protein KRP23_6426 [Phytophthora ramorum]|uniref:uncharacterized protein n=1 Tax=Phytophthora ramorum TaxID=164328 RepID=UPI0030A32386|nr:hypothetical protein KRP23_6426 [Phytophthora ramorum]KAH7505320.1 hypothetical protein KRP22_5794 [Phytophthora ramorum]
MAPPRLGHRPLKTRPRTLIHHLRGGAHPGPRQLRRHAQRHENRLARGLLLALVSSLPPIRSPVGRSSQRLRSSEHYSVGGGGLHETERGVRPRGRPLVPWSQDVPRAPRGARGRHDAPCRARVCQARGQMDRRDVEGK